MSKRKIPEFLTKEEQNKLINIFNIRYFTSHRNRMMIQLFLAAGLRLSEMINLKWRDINLTSGRLKVVQGKGNKDRMLFISEGTLSLLADWKIRQAEQLGVCEYVFTNRDKGQLKDRDIRDMVYTYSKKAGIDKTVSPHTLRHSYATDLLSDCKNIRLVQKALGHSDLSTTMIYTHIVDDEYEEALKNFRR